MNPIHREDKELFIEGVSCREIAAKFGTPVFAYSRASIEQAWQLHSRWMRKSVVLISSLLVK